MYSWREPNGKEPQFLWSMEIYNLDIHNVLKCGVPSPIKISIVTFGCCRISFNVLSIFKFEDATKYILPQDVCIQQWSNLLEPWRIQGIVWCTQCSSSKISQWEQKHSKIVWIGEVLLYTTPRTPPHVPHGHGKKKLVELVLYSKKQSRMSSLTFLEAIYPTYYTMFNESEGTWRLIVF